MIPPRTLAVLLAVPLLLLLGGCGSGVSTAAEVDGFASCLDDVGSSTDGSDGWDTQEQLAFWGRPGNLSCAMTELDEDQLSDALGDAFSDPEDADEPTAIREGQQAAVRFFATEIAADQGEEAAVAVAAVATVLDAGWFEDDDDSRTIRQIAGLAILQGTDALTGYDEYLERNDSQGEDTIFYFSHYADDVAGYTAETKETTERLQDLSDAIADAT